jgi:hypothetical protein
MREPQFKPCQRNRGTARTITADSANRHDIARDAVLTLSFSVRCHNRNSP